MTPNRQPRRAIHAVVGAVCALAALLSLAATAPVAAQERTACPPGQPSGQPPGQQPIPNRQPPGRPSYPFGECQLRLSQSVAAAGTSVTAEGEGYAPGSEVAVRLSPGDRLAAFRADGQGAFRGDILIPATTDPGTYRVLATGVEAGGAPRELSATLDVTAASSAGGGAGGGDAGRVRGAAAPAPSRSTGVGALARTGAELLPFAGVGIALVASGTVAVIGSRRRRAALRG